MLKSDPHGKEFWAFFKKVLELMPDEALANLTPERRFIATATAISRSVAIAWVIGEPMTESPEEVAATILKAGADGQEYALAEDAKNEKDKPEQWH